MKSFSISSRFRAKVAVNRAQLSVGLHTQLDNSLVGPETIHLLISGPLAQIDPVQTKKVITKEVRQTEVISLYILSLLL